MVFDATNAIPSGGRSELILGFSIITVVLMNIAGSPAVHGLATGFDDRPGLLGRQNFQGKRDRPASLGHCQLLHFGHGSRQIAVSERWIRAVS